MQKNPFGRSMFDSQAREGTSDTLLLALFAGFLLVGLLYIIRSYLRGSKGSIDIDDVGDQDLTAPRRSYFGSVVTLVSKKRSARERALSRLVEFDPPSINCTIIRTQDGREVDEDAGRATIFHANGETFIQNKSFFITTPDGIKAEDRALFTGEGEIMNLWFLHDRIPHTVNCEVVERVRFPPEVLRDMDPKVGVACRLVPVTTVAKRDKRQAIRFSHKVGRGSMRVYPQILFDVFVQKTDFRFPTQGSITPRIDVLNGIPFKETKDEEKGNINSEQLVGAFKEAIRSNHTEDRVAYVGKPYMDEKTNKRTLIPLGFSDVLGLGAQEAGRTIHLKKPLKSMVVKKNRRDPNFLSEGDTLVLNYFSRSQVDGTSQYFQMVCEIIKAGIENVTVRPRSAPCPETDLPLEILDFSVNGFRFQNIPEFMRYNFPQDQENLPMEERREILENTGFLFTFYPKLRFNRDTQAYKPDLPLKFPILGKIVRCEVQKSEDEPEGEGKLVAFGVRFMYDPVEYSMDDYIWDRWNMIRPFKENDHFKEVHKSLNGLIAHLESQSKEFTEPRKPGAQTDEKELVS